MNKAIECKSVSKDFGKTQALSNINLTFEKDKIYGLLGPNGAGKTTLLQLISTIIYPNEGTIEIDGENVFENSKALNQLCFVKENQRDLKEFRIDTILEMAAGFYPHWDEEFKEQLVKKFKLKTSTRHQKASKGMQSMVSIIIGMASRAPITIFDEPVLGLDAGAREMFYQILLEDYEKYPRTIIFSTHLIDEVSNVFEEIFILNGGKLQLHGNVQALKDLAFYVTGKKELVSELTSGKRIVFTEELGSTYICGVLGEWSQEELRYIDEVGVQLSSIPLQKLFIYLTREGN